MDLESLESGLSNFKALLSIHEVEDEAPQDSVKGQTSRDIRGSPSANGHTLLFSERATLAHKCKITQKYSGEKIFRPE